MISGGITKPEKLIGEMKSTVPQLTGEINNSNPVLVGLSYSQGGGNPYAVAYVDQDLTYEQRAQARENIDRYVWYTTRIYGNNQETIELADIYENTDNNIIWVKALATQNVSGAGVEVTALGEIAYWSSVFFETSSDDSKITYVRYIVNNFEALRANEAISANEIKIGIGGLGSKTYGIQGAKEVEYSFGIYYNSTQRNYTLTWDDNRYRQGYIVYDRVSDSIVINKLVFNVFDESLTKANQYAEAKIVGDRLRAIDSKIGENTVQEQIAEAIKNKAESDHNHDDVYEKKGVIGEAIIEAKLFAEDVGAKALKDAKVYTDSKATDYDAAGSAAQALVDAKKYTDDKSTDYEVAGAANIVQENLDKEIERAKSEEKVLANEIAFVSNKTLEIQDELGTEVARAKIAEEKINDKVKQVGNIIEDTRIELIEESNRAKDVEAALRREIEQVEVKAKDTKEEVSDLKKFVGTLPDSAESNTVVDYIDEKIAEINSDDIDLSDYALKTDLPKALSELKEDSTHRTVTDEEKNSWNNKAEISDIPTKVSELTNDKNYLTEVHNVQTDAHNDIRLLIVELTNRLEALANSDDDTLDQMAEVVAYIKANRDLIEQVTTKKVNVDDIINNLTTNVANKPLSAAQGVILKTLIDNINISLSNYALKSDLIAAANELNNAVAQKTQVQIITWEADD